ncbi:MAG: nucleotidyltransferase domain-containing protein [Bacteroidales bacterium]|nr:nucleotidyltransferase domain-containing protein [Bacteroidales bacterium]
MKEQKKNCYLCIHNNFDFIMFTPKMVLIELKRYLVAQFGDDIQEVILFGSQTTGISAEDSDYDILIVLSNDYDWKYQNLIFDKAFDVGLKYQVLFDLHLLSENERNNSLKGREPIIINALERGIHA